MSKLFKGSLQEANNFFLALVVFMSTSTAKSSGFSNIKEEELGNDHNRVLAIAIGLTKITGNLRYIEHFVLVRTSSINTHLSLFTTPCSRGEKGCRCEVYGHEPPMSLAIFTCLYVFNMKIIPTEWPSNFLKLSLCIHHI